MATPSSIASILENSCADFARDYPVLYGAPWCRARVQKAALECEESWSVWDEVTSHQVRASNLPLIYVDVILKLISEERKAFYDEFRRLRMGVLFGPGKAVFKWEQLHYDLVGRFIEKLMVLLRFSTMQAEEDVFKQTEAVERMYQAEVQDRVPWSTRLILILGNMLYMLPVSTPQESVMQYFSAISTLLYAVMVSYVSLLVFVYRYLTGCVDKGGTLTCSSGSFQFRATFISVVLFEGAYVWIKFRDVAPTESGGKRRSQEDRGSSKSRKIEARYTPRGQSGRHLYLSMCRTVEEAAILKQIAALLYGGDERQLALGGGRYFQVPLTSRKEGEGLSVEEKRVWVAKIVKKVYKLFAFEKAIDPASLHPSEDAAKYISFENQHLLGSPAQETRVSDAVPGSEDVCNGAATSKELFMGEDGVLQESAIGEWAMMSCFLSALEGVQNSDVATPVGVNFGMALMAESKPDECAMILISGKDEKIQELNHENQELKYEIQENKQTIEKQDQTILEMNQKTQELEQKILELEQRAREPDNWIAALELDDKFSGALPCVDPEMMEFDLDVLA